MAATTLEVALSRLDESSEVDVLPACLAGPPLPGELLAAGVAESGRGVVPRGR